MKKKPDPVVEKLDEILKTLRRIEAKPAPAPVYVNPFPFSYYPPIYVQPNMPFPIYPQITWSSPSITVCGTEANSGSYTYAVNNACVDITLCGGN